MPSQEANRCTFGCWEDGSAVTGVRRLWGGVAALALAIAGLVAISTTPAHSNVGSIGSTSGRHVFATEGAAPDGLKDQIAWISWGTPGGTIASGTAVTNWVGVSDTSRLEVTCTLDRVSGPNLHAIQPSSSHGLEARFRAPQSADAGFLAQGVALANEGVGVFDVDCSASLVTYDGAGWSTANRVGQVPVKLAGLVFADAESTRAPGLLGGAGERLSARPVARDAGTTVQWRVVDQLASECSAGPVMQAQRAADGTLTLTTRTALGFGLVRECSGSSATAMVTVFAAGAKGFRVTLDGSVGQAAAIGYMLPVDFGDAPHSYGVAGAGHLGWTSGSVFTSSSAENVSSSHAVSLPLQQGVATTATAPRLGAAVTTERVPVFAGDPADDAFGSSPPGDLPALPGEALSLKPLCRGPGSVSGWIDWNRNGVFDAGEQSDVQTCSSTSSVGESVTLTWTVPSDVVGGPTYARLVVAEDAAEIAPVGIVSRGEVEDHPVTLSVPRLSVMMTADVGEVPAAGHVVTYTVTVTNTGDVPFTSDNRAYVYNAYAGVDDDAVLGTPTSSVPGEASGQNPAQRLQWWEGPIPVGGHVTFTLPVAMRTGDPGDLVLRNQVRVSTTELTGSAPTAPCEPEEVAEGGCVAHELFRVGLDVTKQAFRKSDMSPLADGVDLAPGTEVVWRYTVQNTGSIALADVVLSDAVSETRTDLDGSTTSTSSPVISCPGSPAVASGTTVTIPSLAPGAERVCEAEGVVGGP